MNYKDWKPIYEEIIKDFGYSKEKDIMAANVQSEVRGSDSLKILKRLQGSSVEILGPYAENPSEKIVMIAGASLSHLDKIDIDNSFLVTDLDGDTILQKEKNKDGLTTLIHAHGDNIDLIKKYSPEFTGHVISTCQCRPLENVYNFGGFTDGDRCVFIADHFKAKKVILNGWDLENPAPKGDKRIKKKKLKWAHKLIRLVDIPISVKQSKGL